MNTNSHHQELQRLEQEASSRAGAVQSAEELRRVESSLLGKDSPFGGLLKHLKSLPPEQRGAFGQAVNGAKARIKALLEERLAALESAAARTEDDAARAFDPTLPGTQRPLGSVHPVTAVQWEIERIFVRLGFTIEAGPEMESEHYNFEALNIPADHPARDMQDTFYLEQGGLLLRTHTSAAQIHYMLANPHPPRVRIVCPGKVYRRDSDITHSPMFHQIEGLVVGPGITLGHLKGTIEAFLHALFGPQYPVRFRPSFFPYTEPSVEADLGCIVCGGGGRLASGDPCRVCKTTGWLEILGSGLVHPAVFEAVNARLGSKVYDPEVISGFAFGLGLERVAMVRHGIDDIRSLYENDLRLLEQFPG